MSPRKGTIVDWLVHMKRILEENMLDYAITHNTVDETLVKKVANLLSEFYVSSPGIAKEPGLYREKLKGEVHSVYRVLVNASYQLPFTLIEQLTTCMLHLINDQAALFDKRITKGRIVYKDEPKFLIKANTYLQQAEQYYKQLNEYTLLSILVFQFPSLFFPSFHKFQGFIISKIIKRFVGL